MTGQWWPWRNRSSSYPCPMLTCNWVFMANKLFTVEFICYQVSSQSLNHFFFYLWLQLFTLYVLTFLALIARSMMVLNLSSSYPCPHVIGYSWQTSCLLLSLSVIRWVSNHWTTFILSLITTFYLICLNFLGLDGLVDDGPEPLLILLPAAHHAVQDPAHVSLTLCSRGSPEMEITKNKNPFPKPMDFFGISEIFFLILKFMGRYGFSYGFLDVLELFHRCFV